MRQRWLCVAAVLACGAAPAGAQGNPCRLVGKAEVRATMGSAVTSVSPGVGNDAQAATCEFGVERGGLTIVVQDRSALEGRSLSAWLDGMEPKIPFRAVPGIGDEAFLASVSAEAVAGKPDTVTSTLFFAARQGQQVLNIVVVVTGKAPSHDAICKIGRRALLRMAPPR